jgi:hypothetical protein
MAVIRIVLPSNEYTALRELAEREYRDPRSQAAFIVRRELERRDLLPGKPCHTAVVTETAVTGGASHDPD